LKNILRAVLVQFVDIMRLLVHRPEEHRARIYVKRFPAPSQGTGNSALSLVAGPATHTKGGISHTKLDREDLTSSISSLTTNTQAANDAVMSYMDPTRSHDRDLEPAALTTQ
jgi:hypothetical protein